MSRADIGLTGDIIEVDPGAVGAGNDALCAKDHAECIALGEDFKDLVDLTRCKLAGAFHTPAGEDLVCVVVTVVIVIVTAAGAGFTVLMVVFVLVLMIVMATAALLTVLMVVFVLVLMIVMTTAALLTVFVVVFVLVIVMTTAALLTVLMVVFVLVLVIVMTTAALLTVLMVVFVFMMMTATAALMVMVAVLLCLGLEMLQLVCERVGALHCGEELCTREGIPIGRDNGRMIVVRAEKCNRCGDLLVTALARVAEHDTACVFDLIVEEFAKVLHIHLALVDVNNGGEAVQDSPLHLYTLNGADDIGELADTRRLNENAIGREFGQHLFQCLAEVPDEGAADTARVHFGDLNARILHEAAVDADLTEFVFDQNELFADICLFDELFQKCGLSRTEKARKNIDFCHDSIKILSE